MRDRALMLAMLLAAGAAGCTDEGATGPVGEGAVTIRFAASRAQGSTTPAPAGGTDGALVIAGANGTLTVTDIRMIVREFEFKQDSRVDECDAGGPGNRCREVELSPFLLDLPLTQGTVVLGTDALPTGAYEEVEFEVDNALSGEDRPALVELLTRIRAQAGLTDWPEEASMLIVGSFAPAGGGAARPFRVFFDAELEAETTLVPPLVITEAGASRTVTFAIDPRRWLVVGPGVVDLSQFNGRVVEFDFQINQGLEVDVDD